jgi:aromatic-amino-acid transaminase
VSSTLQSPFPTTLIPSAASRPGDDPIFSLNAEANRRAQAGESILNATLGALMEDDGKLALLPSVAEAISRVPAAKAAAYAPIAGPPAFLKAVVRDTFGDSPLGEQAIAVATPGATGAILHAITSFLEPGQSLLTTSYFWSPYQIIASHMRRGVELFDMFDEAGRFDTRAFEKGLAASIARQGRALVVFNFPCHNPTGYSLDEAEWSEVSAIVTRHAERAPVTFLIDFAYAHFGAPGSEKWIHHAEAMSGAAQVLVAWTASKAYAQYGARVGALIAPNADEAARTDLRNALSFACRGTWSNCNHLGMLAVTELLENEELRAASRDERARLVQLLDERVAAFNSAASQRSFVYPRYEGGFFVTVFTPHAERVAAHMREAGVYVVPINGAVRIALCSTPRAAIPRLVDALTAGLEAAGADA